MDFRFTPGRVPLLVSMPHVGTDLPDEIAAQLTPVAALKADTDWHLERLYDFLGELGASTLAARWSRYAIDLNRPEENTNLYPGQDTTGLCPLDTFHSEPLYRDGQTPDSVEMRRRIDRYFRPYHDRLQSELERLLAQFGKVVLWDAHSIASVVPRFFPGKLPDLNLGTADGRSCASSLRSAVFEVALSQGRYTVALNGRFKGGHITRHYGRPAANVHALQLEMSQCIYMDEAAPFTYRPERAAEVEGLLRRMVEAALAWAQA